MPLLILVLAISSLVYRRGKNGQSGIPKISWFAAQGMTLGLLLAVSGAYLFGSGWEQLQLQHAYFFSHDMFSPPPCADYATACLLESPPGHSTQYPKALVAAGLWYLGAFFWLREIDAVVWTDRPALARYMRKLREKTR